MKRTLEKAPLVHAVIHLEISPCPDLRLSKPSVEEAVVSSMIDVGFPDYIKTSRNVINLAGAEDSDLDRISLPRRVFRSQNQRMLIEFDDKAVIFKTSDYTTFEEFSTTFLSVISNLTRDVPQFNKVIMRRIGLRYIDVIVPSDSSGLATYIKHAVLPTDLNSYLGLKGVPKLDGITKSRAQTAEGSIMVLQFEELATADGSVWRVIPENLSEHDDKCVLSIRGQDWWREAGCSTYGILDIDHFHMFDESPKVDMQSLSSKLKSLYRASSDVFWALLTDKAISEWGEKVSEEQAK